MSRVPWRGEAPKPSRDAEVNIARMEIASTKVCGNCGRIYDAWMDLDEWVCFLCALHPERLP